MRICCSHRLDMTYVRYTVCCNTNYHLEHHDFPNIPVSEACVGNGSGLAARRGSTDSRRCATCKAWVAPSEPDDTLSSGHSGPSVLSTQLGGSVCRGCIR